MDRLSVTLCGWASLVAVVFVSMIPEMAWIFPALIPWFVLGRVLLWRQLSELMIADCGHKNVFLSAFFYVALAMVWPWALLSPAQVFAARKARPILKSAP